MQLWSAPRNYGVIPRLLHWLTVDLVILAWVLGTFGDELSRGSARSAGLFLHISAGLAVLALLVFRLVWRVIDRPPPPETTRFGNWLECLGKLTHVMLYALLAATPRCRRSAAIRKGDALPLFGIVEIASPWARDRVFAQSIRELHETLSNILVILATFHAVAAMVHHFVWRDRTLERMLPLLALR